jgi:hypothetical protein
MALIKPRFPSNSFAYQDGMNSSMLLWQRTYPVELFFFVITVQINLKV